MVSDDLEKWNRIYQSNNQHKQLAAPVLRDYQYLLPTDGVALDLACGLGANALVLAKRGLDTHAWDISDQAISTLAKRVEEESTKLHLQIRDVSCNPPETETFDVIVVCRFLDRHIVPSIINALRLNGLLFYQTFIKEKIDDTGPGNPDYRLGANELLTLFKPLHILLYREDGLTGEQDQGFRNEAMLIGQKR